MKTVAKWFASLLSCSIFIKVQIELVGDHQKIEIKNIKPGKRINYGKWF